VDLRISKRDDDVVLCTGLFQTLCTGLEPLSTCIRFEWEINDDSHKAVELPGLSRRPGAVEQRSMVV
jgi:hypothetical protein